MSARIGSAVRVATGVALLVLSIEALRTSGWVRWLAGAEIAASAAFCLPRVWRIAGAALLAILGVAFLHHAVGGHFAASLFFAALAILMALVYERT
jgi:hypothetical protein